MSVSQIADEWKDSNIKRYSDALKKLNKIQIETGERPEGYSREDFLEAMKKGEEYISQSRLINRKGNLYSISDGVITSLVLSAVDTIYIRDSLREEAKKRVAGLIRGMADHLRAKYLISDYYNKLEQNPDAIHNHKIPFEKESKRGAVWILREKIIGDTCAQIFEIGLKEERKPPKIPKKELDRMMRWERGEYTEKEKRELEKAEKELGLDSVKS